MTRLLDGNVLIALVLDSHEFHRRSTTWFSSHQDSFATSTVTQGTLLRLHMRLAQDNSSAAAWNVLRLLTAHPRHVFLPESFSYLEINPTPLHAPSQVTNAWLAHLAEKHSCLLATFDVPLSRRHSSVARLLPLHLGS